VIHFTHISPFIRPLSGDILAIVKALGEMVFGSLEGRSTETMALEND
jgi:hypothetical protein